MFFVVLNFRFHVCKWKTKDFKCFPVCRSQIVHFWKPKHRKFSLLTNINWIEMHCRFVFLCSRCCCCYLVLCYCFCNATVHPVVYLIFIRCLCSPSNKYLLVEFRKSQFNFKIVVWIKRSRVCVFTFEREWSSPMSRLSASTDETLITIASVARYRKTLIQIFSCLDGFWLKPRLLVPSIRIIYVYRCLSSARNTHSVCLRG